MLDGYHLEMIKLEDSVFLIGQCSVLTGAIKIREWQVCRSKILR